MMQAGIFTGYFPYGLKETAEKIRGLGFNTVQLDLHFKDVDLGAGQCGQELDAAAVDGADRLVVVQADVDAPLVRLGEAAQDGPVVAAGHDEEEAPIAARIVVGDAMGLPDPGHGAPVVPDE